MSDRFEPHDYAEALVNGGQYAHESGVMFQWTGLYWQAIKEEDAETDAYRWLVRHKRSHASRENARRAVHAAILWSGKLPEPARDVVIPCSNGYVHVVDGELRLLPPNHTLGLQHALMCDYDPTVVAPERFLRFLRTVLPDEAVRARVQEYVGYTLTADARYQRAQLWLGSGANGKGVLANIVQALHGRPESVQLDALDGFRLSVLIGASLIYSDETPRGRINEQLLKSLIAGERVQVDRKYRDPVSIHVRGKWLVLGNHLPTITDHSTGFWRRWDIVPFSVTIPESERDPLLAEHIISSELSGVLAWALEGLTRLQKRGAFEGTVPLAMSRLLHQAKAETNSVQAWYDDCAVTVSANHGTAKDDVFEHYRRWCDRHGLTPMASPRFWTRMKELIPIEDFRLRHGKSQIRMCNLELPPDGCVGGSSSD
ncbi:DNA primase [Burkholderia savannae]|uniref:DNA primase family protein n=1 Tax=Burkholderia savannae TaxID=1637837 RepID=UPI000758AF92|nr:phage/plasmid primase, P4 family [Burkholderia savannae]AOJ81821.1 DNA primase [Burkholderia savannae]